MTLSDITGALQKAGIEDAASEAAQLICHFAGISRARLLAEKPDRSWDAQGLAEAVEKRTARTPLQYILGQWEFYGLPFFVSEDCLIPRPDTEILAERAIACLSEGGRLLDLCTGSGCIPAAVLKNTTHTTGVAVELYPKTLAVAEKNLLALGLHRRCTLLLGDATADLFPAEEKFHVITSNPPYVTAEEMESLAPELAFEPPHALTDGGNGLSILEAIVGIYKSHLADGGVMLLEHGWRQGEAVKQIAKKYGMTYRGIKDYGGNVRVAELRNAT